MPDPVADALARAKEKARQERAARQAEEYEAALARRAEDLAKEQQGLAQVPTARCFAAQPYSTVCCACAMALSVTEHCCMCLKRLLSQPTLPISQADSWGGTTGRFDDDGWEIPPDEAMRPATAQQAAAAASSSVGFAQWEQDVGCAASEAGAAAVSSESPFAGPGVLSVGEEAGGAGGQPVSPSGTVRSYPPWLQHGKEASFAAPAPAPAPVAPQLQAPQQQSGLPLFLQQLVTQPPAQQPLPPATPPPLDLPAGTRLSSWLAGAANAGMSPRETAEQSSSEAVRGNSLAYQELD